MLVPLVVMVLVPKALHREREREREDLEKAFARREKEENPTSNKDMWFHVCLWPMYMYDASKHTV